MNTSHTNGAFCDSDDSESDLEILPPMFDIHDENVFTMNTTAKHRSRRARSCRSSMPLVDISNLTVPPRHHHKQDSKEPVSSHTRSKSLCRPKQNTIAKFMDEMDCKQESEHLTMTTTPRKTDGDEHSKLVQLRKENKRLIKQKNELLEQNKKLLQNKENVIYKLNILQQKHEKRGEDDNGNGVVRDLFEQIQQSIKMSENDFATMQNMNVAPPQQHIQSQDMYTQAIYDKIRCDLEREYRSRIDKLTKQIKNVKREKKTLEDCAYEIDEKLQRQRKMNGGEQKDIETDNTVNERDWQQLYDEKAKEVHGLKNIIAALQEMRNEEMEGAHYCSCGTQGENDDAAGNQKRENNRKELNALKHELHHISENQTLKMQSLLEEQQALSRDKQQLQLEHGDLTERYQEIAEKYHCELQENNELKEEQQLLMDKAAKLESTCAIKEQEIECIKQEMHQLLNEHKLRAEQCEDMQVLLNETKSKYDTLWQQIKNNDSDDDNERAEVLQLKERVGVLQQQSDTQQSEILEKKRQYRALEREHDRLSALHFAEQTKFHESIMQSNSVIFALKAEIEKLKKENDHSYCQREIGWLEKQHSEYKERSQFWTEQISLLSKGTQEMEKQINCYLKEITDLRAHIRRLESPTPSEEVCTATNNNKLDALQQTYEEKLKRKEEMIESLALEMAQLKLQCRSLHQKNKEYEHKFIQMTIEHTTEMR
eukprot:CAMPEP_0202692592 /NCGR_PEP_ID=MMETSP1385-20130828/6928_1 /ASSEMBLY_ACC=CAM_ASM_000861 /TAXON_ID=933848 /ORGANISM="Elphidium margaritaceum" /LENGTH=710 /DNA_ID=CAMNT_0049348145 /DNA_START=42 /DNA_END=2170 /DNA_ORIENTATION=-